MTMAIGTPASSKISDSDWKYPLLAPRRADWMKTSDGTVHSVYWEEYGNPRGQPVMVLHGGPGGNCAPIMSRFFDARRYRVIMFDQRGCGKSMPNTEDDPVEGLANNTTPHLIRDIMQLRETAGIDGKMILFGGSWGGTLALATAIAHPDVTEALVLRSTFLGRRKDVDYLYQGNANTLKSYRPPGAYQTYPEGWQEYVSVIPPQERFDMVKAYNKILFTPPTTDAGHQRLVQAALAWTLWQIGSSHVTAEPGVSARHAHPSFALPFARMENHYFMNGSFLGGSGEANRDNNYLLDNIRRLRDIPVYSVHGRYDQVCPLSQQQELTAALRRVGNTGVTTHITNAGHSMLEIDNCRALTDVMDDMPLVAARPQPSRRSARGMLPVAPRVAAEPA